MNMAHVTATFLRRAFRRGGGVWLPLLMAVMTAFMLLFAVHTALPDMKSKNTRLESHLLLFRFESPISSMELQELAKDNDFIEDVCAVSVISNEKGIALFGLRGNQPQENGSLEMIQFSGSEGQEGSFMISEALIPSEYVGQAGSLTMQLQNQVFTCRGLMTSTYDVVPEKLSPGFFANYQSESVALTLGGDAPQIHDESISAEIHASLYHVKSDELPSIDEFRAYGNIWGNSYAGIFLPLDTYVSLDIPVAALYVTTTSSADKAFSIVSAMLPEGSWTRETDYDDYFLRDSAMLYARIIKNSMASGIVPFYTLLLLSQMAVWGIWLDRFRPAIRDLHIIGVSFSRQAFSLVLCFLLIMIAAYCTGLFLFSVIYPACESVGLLWGTEPQVILYSALSYFLSHVIYAVIHIAIMITRAKRGEQL